MKSKKNGMTEEQRKDKMQEYVNTCAQIGEIHLSIELSQASLASLQAKQRALHTLLKEKK